MPVHTSIAETDRRRPLQAMFEVLTLIAVAWLATRGSGLLEFLRHNGQVT